MFTVGSELSVFNAQLVEVADERKGELAVGIMDDVVFLAKGESFRETHRRMKDMFSREGGAQHWAASHHSQFKMSKLAVIDFTRRRKKVAQGAKTMPVPRTPLTLDSHKITPSPFTRYLGVLIDQELRFKEHATAALAKGTQWALQAKRLSKLSAGMPHRYARRLYKAVGIPKMLYTADVWCCPLREKPGGRRMMGSVGFASQLARVQHISALQATGALHTTTTDSLNVHASLLPMGLSVNKICFVSAVRLAVLPRTHPLRIGAQ
jgi:hypothetical protein